MIAKSGSSLIFYAHYVNGGTSATGLTVTVDIWEVQRDGTAAEIVTAGAATEIGDGLYRYLLASGSVDAAAEYISVFKTAGTVDQEHLPAIWTVDRNVPEAASTTIGANGAGLTAVPWNAAWDAEVQSEVADALAATDAIGAASISAAAAAKIADVVLRRTAANIEASASGDTLSVESLYGLIMAAFEASLSGTTLTIRKSDASTLGTKTVTVDASADPITGIT